MADALRIAVCLAAPPAAAARPGAAHSAASSRRSPGAADLAALEHALRIRASAGSPVEVHALTAGDDALAEVSREARAMGADEAWLVPASAAPAWDSLAVASLLAAAVERLGCDLVLCGDRSTDGMHGITGPAIAHVLGRPLIRNLVELSLEGETALRGAQKLERGARMLWKCALPAVCTVDRTIAEPRYIPVYRRIVAGRRPIPRVEVADGVERVTAIRSRFGDLVLERLVPPRIRPKKVAAPPPSLAPADRLKALRAAPQPERKGERLRGEPATVARRIAEFLAENGFV